MKIETGWTVCKSDRARNQTRLYLIIKDAVVMAHLILCKGKDPEFLLEKGPPYSIENIQEIIRIGTILVKEEVW